MSSEADMQAGSVERERQRDERLASNCLVSFVGGGGWKMNGKRFDMSRD